MTTRNRPRLILLALALLLAAPVAAQIISAPLVRWIGPEASCDFATIQEALDEIFFCPLGVFCPPERNELRLSNNYRHSGQIVVSRSFDIRGGFSNCDGPVGAKTELTAPPGQPLVIIQPGSGTIESEFRSLSLTGGTTPVDRGGVIRMEAGNARLTLRESRVRFGNAVSGGGIYLAGDGNRLVIRDTQVLDNASTNGGGLYCTRGGEIDFQSGGVETNTAERNGGGFYLEAGCRLRGKTPRADRTILGNVVNDTQQGQGGGIYALDSEIEMGALLSRTIFQQNMVEWFPLHDYEKPGQNQGGAVHLESSEATFYNTWFRGNEAADGGAISASGDTHLLVDRYSGPCDITDTGNSPDCSLFEFNRARGGKDEGGDEGGDGAVLFTKSGNGSFPDTTISRSTLRTNFASCYEGSSSSLSGECDLDFFAPGRSRNTTQSIIGQISVMTGNLMYNNDIGDDDDCFDNGCTKEGFQIFFPGLFAENTLAQNRDSDEVFLVAPVEIVNNVIWDFEPDKGVSNERDDRSTISSCNISNFAADFDELADSVPIASLNSEPFFVNPDLGSSPNESFQIENLNSPVIDRCDDQEGRLSLPFDILGTPRSVDIGGISHGPGFRDAGAFEFVQDGFVNNTADLEIVMQSALPRRAEIDQPHRFTIQVTNTGRNLVNALSVSVDNAFLGSVDSLRGVNTFDANGNLVPVWDCDRLLRRCVYLPDNLNIGDTTPDIVAELSFGSAGFKAVTVAVNMQDSALVEVNASNNLSTDSVTVGPGADLSIDLIANFPATVDLNQSQPLRFIVRNNGPQLADNVRLHLTAAGGQIEFFEGNDWNCDSNARMCTRSSPLQPDTREEFTAEVRYTEPGNKIIEAQIMRSVGSVGDPDESNNFDAEVIAVIPAPVDDLFFDSFEGSP